jgi:hypothetical protein
MKPTFLRYIEECDIYVLDYSGTISYQEGLARMEILDEYLRARIADGASAKLVLDVRTTIWDTEEAHDALSRIARQKFHPDHVPYRVYLAVLNNELSFRVSDSEQWFTDMGPAIDWLSQLPHPSLAET